MGLLNLGFRLQSLANTFFHRNRILQVPRSIFVVLLKASGAVFLVLCALETGLKIDGFLIEHGSRDARVATLIYVRSGRYNSITPDA